MSISPIWFLLTKLDPRPLLDVATPISYYRDQGSSLVKVEGSTNVVIILHLLQTGNALHLDPRSLLKACRILIGSTQGSRLKFGQATECIHFSLTIASRSLDPRTTKHYVSRLTPEIVLLGGSGLKFGQAASYEFIKPRTA